MKNNIKLSNQDYRLAISRKCTMITDHYSKYAFLKSKEGRVAQFHNESKPNDAFHVEIKKVFRMPIDNFMFYEWHKLGIVKAKREGYNCWHDVYVVPSNIVNSHGEPLKRRFNNPIQAYRFLLVQKFGFEYLLKGNYVVFIEFEIKNSMV